MDSGTVEVSGSEITLQNQTAVCRTPSTFGYFREDEQEVGGIVCGEFRGIRDIRQRIQE